MKNIISLDDFKTKKTQQKMSKILPKQESLLEKDSQKH